MDKNLEPYVIIKDEDIVFKGDTPEEKKLNEWLYNITLELNRYQDMTEELLEFCQERLDKEKPISPNEVIKLIKEWNC